LGVLAIGMLVEKLSEAEQGVETLIGAIRGLDGTDRQADKLAESLSRIPIIGRLSSQVWQMFGTALGATSTQQQAAWTRLTASMEDGQLKVGILGRSVNGLVKLFTLGAVDIKGDIDAINESLVEMNKLIAVQKSLSPSGQQTDRATNDRRQAASDDAAMIGLEGVERVREAERQRYAAAMRFFDDQRAANNEATKQVVAALREQEATEAEIAKAKQISQQRLVAIELTRVETQRALNQLAQDALIMAEREATAKRDAAQAEARQARRNAERQDNQLFIATISNRAQLDGRGFDAERLQLESQRREAIAQLERDGNDELLKQTNGYYDSRRALIDAREAEEVDRKKKRLKEEADATLSTNDRLQSQLTQARLRNAGRDVEARQESIRQRFAEQIKDLQDKGNAVGVDIASKLRDTELAAVRGGNQGQRAQEFSQASFSRTNVNARPPEEDRVAKESLETLKAIRDNTKQKTIATAG